MIIQVNDNYFRVLKELGEFFLMQRVTKDRVTVGNMFYLDKKQLPNFVIVEQRAQV
jgi:hypothetical protein